MEKSEAGIFQVLRNESLFFKFTFKDLELIYKDLEHLIMNNLFFS